jgi:hypothetical protein
MIDFRYHVVSLVAVLLALALGLFLGSTTLQGRVFDDLKGRADQVNRENAVLEQQLAATRSQLSQQQGFAGALEPMAVAGRLSGETVSVVSAPSVTDNVRQSLLTTLQAAGATVTSDVRLQPAFVDPAQAAELGQLAQELSTSSEPATGTTGVERADSELADVLVARSGGPAVTAARLQAVLSAYGDGKLLAVSGTAPTRPADLAVVLVGAADASTDARTAANQDDALLTLAHDMGAAAAGAVVAGPSPVTGASGVLDAARKGDAGLIKGVSTVDSVDQAAGRITAVLALQAARSGVTGSYGPTRPSPLPTTSTTP